MPERSKIWAMLTSCTPRSRDGQRRRHPLDDHVGPAARDHLRRGDVGAARQDRDVEVGVLVVALLKGDVVARELRLGDPLQLQRQLVGRLGRGRTQDQCRRNKGACRCPHDAFPPAPRPAVMAHARGRVIVSGAVGRMPEGDRALEQRQETIEQRAADRRNHDRAPHQIDVHAADLGRDPEAHADGRRAEELGDDRADQRERRVDLERVEDERQRARQPQP